MDDRAIGMFDSGVGGLTVARALIDLMPNENLVYLGDTARGPFGPLSLDTVRRYSFEIVDDLVAGGLGGGADARGGVKLVVMACNTATAAALTEARAHYRVPMVGVIEPGVRAAISATRNARVGVIGTAGTVQSGAYQAAMKASRSGVTLMAVACPRFVEFVEAGEVDGPAVRGAAAEYLEPLRAADIDTLILGCTHYPLMARVIGDVMGRRVVLISSADETAFEVKHLLAATGQLRTAAEPAWHHFVSSGPSDAFVNLGTRFLGPEVRRAEVISWN